MAETPGRIVVLELEAKTAPEYVEHITCNGQPLAFIFRAQLLPAKTAFLTSPAFRQQVGFVVYPKGSEIPRHMHLPIQRHLVGTSEVLIVRQGRCLLDVYNEQRELVATRELQVGDVMLLVAGGHGFRLLEDTIFLEIKQGPYLEVAEKEGF